MSIAWAPIILLLLLLPGLGAWIGYHTFRRTVENAPSVPSFQLGDTSVSGMAAVVGASLLGHAVMGSTRWFGRTTDYHLLLMALGVGKDDAAPGPLADNIQAYWPWMLAYFAASFVVGVVVGILSALVMGRFASRLLQLGWVRNLLPPPDQEVEAEVELVVADGCKCRVFFIGRLVEYRATRRGVISELVLANAQRFGGEPARASAESTSTSRPAVEGAVPYTVIPGNQILAVELRRVRAPGVLIGGIVVPGPRRGDELQGPGSDPSPPTGSAP